MRVAPTAGGRPIATAQQAREIMKIGVFYDTVEESLQKNGFAPNRTGGHQGASAQHGAVAVGQYPCAGAPRGVHQSFDGDASGLGP